MRILVRVRHSSPLQQKFFGEEAYRPYLMIISDDVLTADEIVMIIKASQYNEEVKGIIYKKYFELEPGLYEFDYGYPSKYGFGKFYSLGLVEL